DQFYKPYEHYLAPIFAVPGNHDGDNVAPETSLEAFMRNFCSLHPVHTPEAREIQRDAMTQPNVFWTLVTPVCTIIGLYTNVPEGGKIRQDQPILLLLPYLTAFGVVCVRRYYCVYRCGQSLHVVWLVSRGAPGCA